MLNERGEINKLELSINNPFITKSLRQERKPTVFTRVFSRLTTEGKHPGFVIPIFVKINDDTKTFGAFTFNIGGSVSFFPDFFKLDNFDHLTLSTNFIEKKGHLTKSEDHKKLLHLEASKLKTGYYHLITFGFGDGDLLMDATPKVELPDLYYNTDEEKEKYNNWITESVSAGFCILDFPKQEGNYFVQILIEPKNISEISLAVFRGAIEKFNKNPVSLSAYNFDTQIVRMPTPNNCDFNIIVLTLRMLGDLTSEFGFIMGQDPLKQPSNSSQLRNWQIASEE